MLNLVVREITSRLYKVNSQTLLLDLPSYQPGPLENHSLLCYSITTNTLCGLKFMFNWLLQRLRILGHKILFCRCDIRLPLRWPTKDGRMQFWLHMVGRQRTEEPLPCAVLSYLWVFLQQEDEKPVPVWKCLHRINELLCYTNHQSKSQISTTQFPAS
jgi:hypothetical protein